MTTIAFDGTHFASDSRITAEYFVDNGAKKLFQMGDWVIGVCGNYAKCLEFVQDFEEYGEEIDYTAYGSEDGMVVLMYNKKKKKLYRYDGCNRPIPFPFPASVGSGSAFAMGAMYHGATAKEAVQIAAKLDAGTGLPIKLIKV